MKEDICPICDGVKTDSTTSFTVEFNTGVVVAIANYNNYLLAS